MVPRLLRDWLSDWGLSGKRYFGQPPYIYIYIYHIYHIYIYIIYISYIWIHTSSCILSHFLWHDVILPFVSVCPMRASALVKLPLWRLNWWLGKKAPCTTSISGCHAVFPSGLGWWPAWLRRQAQSSASWHMAIPGRFCLQLSDIAHAWWLLSCYYLSMSCDNLSGMEQELDAQPQRRTVLGDLSAGMYWYICYWVVAICGPSPDPLASARSPGPMVWRHVGGFEAPARASRSWCRPSLWGAGWCRGTWYQIHQMHTVDIRWQCNVPWYRRFNSWFWLGGNKSGTRRFSKAIQSMIHSGCANFADKNIKNSLDPTLTWIYDTNYIWLEWCQSPLASSKQLLQLSRGWGAGRNAEWAEWAEWDCTWRALDFRGTRQVCPEMPRVCVRWVTSFILTREIYTCLSNPFYAF